MMFDTSIAFLLKELGSDMMSRTYRQECDLLFAINRFQRDVDELYGYAGEIPRRESDRLEGFIHSLDKRLRKLEGKE